MECGGDFEEHDVIAVTVITNEAYDTEAALADVARGLAGFFDGTLADPAAAQGDFGIDLIEARYSDRIVDAGAGAGLAALSLAPAFAGQHGDGGKNGSHKDEIDDHRGSLRSVAADRLTDMRQALALDQLPEILIDMTRQCRAAIDEAGIDLYQ